MANESNKAMVRRLYDELNKGNMSIADELIVKDYAQHSILPVPRGRLDFKEFFTAFGTAFPDAHFEVLDMLAEGDSVVPAVQGHHDPQGAFHGPSAYQQEGPLHRHRHLPVGGRQGGIALGRGGPAGLPAAAGPGQVTCFTRISPTASCC